MKFKIKLSIALVMSLMLVACGGGGSSKPVKMVKVWKLVEEVATNGISGNTSYILTNTYDKNGFLIRQDHDGDANGQTDSEFRDHYILYDYGSDGFLSKKTFYRASGSKLGELLVDKQGRYTETTDYDENGVISSTGLFVNTYDDKKRIIKEEVSTNNEPVRKIVIFTYEGNIETRESDTDADGQTNNTFILTHNDRGELIKKERYNINQELVRAEDYTYEYDENDNIQTKPVLINGNTGNVITYTWEERSVPEIYAK